MTPEAHIVFCQFSGRIHQTNLIGGDMYCVKELEELKNHIRYDGASGNFFWIDPERKGGKSNIAGGPSNGSITITVCGKQYKGHHVAWYFQTGENISPKSIKHRDGDRKNNRIENLYIPRNEPLSQYEVRKALSYDEETGVFTWNEFRKAKAKKGSIAGSMSSSGYISIYVNNKPYLAHRLAWLYVHGYMPKHIDHIDRDRANNRLPNLREATASQNRYNSISSNNKTGVPGVSFHKATGKYQASITKNRNKTHLGIFPTIEEAISARRAAEVSLGISEYCIGGENDP